jgi:surfeit locus 1 family protein
VTGKHSRRFWLLTAAAAAGFAATLALGAWQMSRAAQKVALQAAIERRQAIAPVSQSELLASRNPADLLHRVVVLRGTWSANRTVFLDNRQMQGKVGFYVVTPLRLEGSDAAVLVQRGWAQRNFLDREKLPPIATPEGVVEVRGRLAPPPAKLYEFAGAAPGRIRQNLDLAQFRAETGLPLLALSVQQIGGPSDGLLREWPEPASGVATNYGYAAQWWALSILIAILYVWFQFVAPRRKVPHA